ncbi:MAG: Flp pilus assembly complex ATPase component TadA [Myxococcaceae bacterium]|nr:Flp pilus assembly complex ATPase component TadA [Myxococcaceae bacterium]
MTLFAESLKAFLKPVLSFLDDDSVSEILINAPDDIWVERKGKLSKTEARFTEEGLLGAARNIAQFVGRPLTDERPRLDARLPDGSRIHVVLPPIARRGASIAIRKFFKDKLGTDALIGFGALTPEMVRFIEACIATKMNVVVSGGTGSGKTTLLNIISSLIPNDERILTLEDSAELQLNQEHQVNFESRPADKFGKGQVTIGDLLQSALRLRPDRIVVGEVRGGEAFDLIQAMNTGHGGSMSTTHANTPVDTLRRLESLALMSAVELPLVAVRAQVASAINVVICCERLHDGTRKVTAISEVLPLNEKGEYRTQDIFVFSPVAKDEQGHILGYHAPTGVLPLLLPKAQTLGFNDLTDVFFDPAAYGVPPPAQVHARETVAVQWAPSLKHREAGLPDPEGASDRLRAFEQQLRADALAKAHLEQATQPRARQPIATPTQVVAVSNVPASKTVRIAQPIPPATAPVPRAQPSARALPRPAKTNVDDDTGDSHITADEEAKVELSQSMLGEMQEYESAPRPAIRNAPRPSAGSGTTRPPVRAQPSRLPPKR